MKVFTAQQIRDLDAFTIKNEPIKSIDLMERASEAFVDWYVNNFDNSRSVRIFCGVGNNGGDGLAVSRLLIGKGYKTETYVVFFSENTSKDFSENFDHLNRLVTISEIHHISQVHEIKDDDVIIDAIFGSGLSRPIKGIAADVIDKINQCKAKVVSIDIPSGVFCDGKNPALPIISANYTISFQLPKLSFLLPENEKYIGDWKIVNIGLSAEYIENNISDYYYTDLDLIKSILKPKAKFSHKGTFGHILVMGGSYGKMGAVILSGKAALKTGGGLVTAYVPKSGYEIIQTALPEAMCLVSTGNKYLKEIPDIDPFDVICVGIGMDKQTVTLKAFEQLLDQVNRPMVIDADGLNLLSDNKELLKKLPELSILTPHPKEFMRLAGKWENDYERLTLQKKFSNENNVIIVLKGAHTSISMPDGKVFFNATGNPGMATAGSGDVLTGIIVSLLGQKYNPKEAAILGVFLHGLAGDLAAKQLSQEALIASDIIRYIGSAWKFIRK